MVSFQTGWLSDLRVAALGAALGYNVFEARGRLLDLWVHCEHAGSTTVGELLVIAALGAGAPAALVSVGLGRRVEGGIDIESPVTASEAPVTVRARSRRTVQRNTAGRFVRRTVDGAAAEPPRTVDGPSDGAPPVPVHVHTDIQTGASAPGESKALTADELVARVQAREGWSCKPDHLERYMPRAVEEQGTGYPEDLVESCMRACEQQVAQERAGGKEWATPSLGMLLGVLRKFRHPAKRRKVPDERRGAPRPAQRSDRSVPEGKPFDVTLSPLRDILQGLTDAAPLAAGA